MNSITTPQATARAEERAKIRGDARKRLAREGKQSGFWHRLLSWWRVESEVRKEMKRRFPPDALYCR